MSSAFSFRGRHVWHTNGTIEALQVAWLDAIRQAGRMDTGIGRQLGEHLRERTVHGFPGGYGFDLEEPPLDEREGRVILIGAVGAVARSAAHEVRGKPLPEPASCWFVLAELAIQETVHAWLRESLDGEPEELVLDVDDTLRAAVDAVRLEDAVRPLAMDRRYSHTGDPARELALRRRQLELMLRAPRWFASEIGREHVYQLADLEEALGELDAAAETTRSVAALTEDADERAVATELADARSEAAKSTPPRRQPS